MGAQFPPPLQPPFCPGPAGAVPGPGCSPPRRLPITSPLQDSPGPGGQQSPPGSCPPTHTHRGVSEPPPTNTPPPQPRRLPIPNCGCLPAGSAGCCGHGGRGARLPPEVTVPALSDPPPSPSTRRSLRPPRCAQVRSAAGRGLRAGRGSGCASPRPRRQGRAGAGAARAARAVHGVGRWGWL